MRQRSILELIRRTVGAALMLGSVGVLSESVTRGDDANCATPAQAGQPQCADDIYKRAGERLAQQLQQMNAQSCCPSSCAAPTDACAAAPSCGNGCGGGCGCGSGWLGSLFCDSGEEPWTLMSMWDDDCGQNCLKDNGTTVAGWLAVGYQSRPDGAFTGNGAAMTQRGEWTNVNINQLYVYLAKAADGSNGMGWGYRADLIYGVDGNDTQAFGNRAGKWDFVNGWDHGPYEWAMPQLYAEVATGNLSVKLGRFYTPVGYEVVTTPDNFFFSKQLTYNNSEPFTHTGALATYKASDKLTVIGGWTLGWDTGFDQNFKGSNGIVGATYAASESTTLVYTAAFGEFGVRGNGAISSFILSHKWDDKLMTVHQFDVLQTNNPVDFTAGGVAGDSIAFINYAFYQLTDKAKAGIRYEWYKPDGVSHNTLTYGVNYTIKPNLVVRPEMRHNWSPGNNVRPWKNDVAGIDMIWKF